MPTTLASSKPRLYFSDFFEVSEADIANYGAFNISLLADLPLFIDPFLLFHSKKERYRSLHDEMIAYLRFLKNKAAVADLDKGLLSSLYTFREIEQTWLGFSRVGNQGRGLGNTFAKALHGNLNKIFHNFGSEEISKGTHLEKLCLIEERVGRDNISDFTTNLIKHYLLEYTESFANKFIPLERRGRFTVNKVRFNYQTETWMAAEFVLPRFNKDFVLLTPKDMLSKEDTWINRRDIVNDFDLIVDAMPNPQLRAAINNYFMKVLPFDPTAEQRRHAKRETARQFPEFFDAYIRYKEDHGQDAIGASAGRVRSSEKMYLGQFGVLPGLLAEFSDFYQTDGQTYNDSLRRVSFLKDVIENKGGHRVFYINGQALRREADLHILYKLTWFGTPLDVTSEANDGRGPVDFKVSRGAEDKTLVEFKLASNSKLEKNLANQTAIYKKASGAKAAIIVIVYFSETELDRVNTILQRLDLTSDPNIVLIDARSDNKPSGSTA
jgi:hypothetical protein